MEVLYAFIVTLTFCGNDFVQGEIPNDIKQFVLSLIQEHNGEVMELKKEIRTLKQEVTSLQRSYLKVLYELDDIRRKENKEELVPVETEIDDRIQKIHAKDPSFQNVSQSNAPQNSAGEKQLSKSVERVRKGRLVPHNMIGNFPPAFSASMSRDLSNLQHNQVLAFDIASLNIGNAFDKTTGVFIPNMKGVYALFATITTRTGKSLEAQIVRNGGGLCNIFAGDSAFPSPGSNMVLVALDVGDHVIVKIHNTYHDSGATIDGAFSTFSGFLLYETD